jgi:hypothetical protein
MAERVKPYKSGINYWLLVRPPRTRSRLLIARRPQER